MLAQNKPIKDFLKKIVYLLLNCSLVTFSLMNSVEELRCFTYFQLYKRLSWSDDDFHKQIFGHDCFYYLSLQIIKLHIVEQLIIFFKKSLIKFF